MNSLNNYIIGPSSENLMFLDLSEMVLNLDRRDFEVGYVVDETMYPKIGSKEASSSGKRKKTPKALQAPLADSSRPITINVSDDDEYVDPIASQPRGLLMARAHSLL